MHSTGIYNATIHFMVNINKNKTQKIINYAICKSIKIVNKHNKV